MMERIAVEVHPQACPSNYPFASSLFVSKGIKLRMCSPSPLFVELLQEPGWLCDEDCLCTYWIDEDVTCVRLLNCEGFEMAYLDTEAFRLEPDVVQDANDVLQRIQTLKRPRELGLG